MRELAVAELNGAVVARLARITRAAAVAACPAFRAPMSAGGDALEVILAAGARKADVAFANVATMVRRARSNADSTPRALSKIVSPSRTALSALWPIKPPEALALAVDAFAMSRAGALCSTADSCDVSAVVSAPPRPTRAVVIDALAADGVGTVLRT